ncbi:MAG TPA: M28 family peptidase [Oligoflexia bacterium]|nr:M28 family peptidase [Oligoflexia bacterium]HMR24692.1 M28 family peptidase [Oligoflexia bacterium]
MFKHLHFYSLVVLSLLLVACNKEKTLYKQLYKDSQEITQKIIDCGPRTVNSPGHKKVQDYIETYLKQHQIALEKLTFTADTPKGPIPMTNLRYKIAGQQAKYPSILLSAHYDSKIFAGKEFLGVNDAATSVALILALTPIIQKLDLPYVVEVVFFDGEEAIVEWVGKDNLYGSRHFAMNHVPSAKIAYAILLDMISDKDLNLVRAHASDPSLSALYKKVLTDMQWEHVLDKKLSFIQDDHLSLIRAGIPTLLIMDFSFGGPSAPGTFWHTEQDNLENVSFENTAKVGQVVLRMLDHFKNNMGQQAAKP